MARFHLHAIDTGGEVRFQTAETDDEAEAAAVAATLAGRGFAVWVYEHDHGGAGEGAYREVGMYVGSVFLPRRD